MRVLVIEKKVAKRYRTVDPPSPDDPEAIQEQNTNGIDPSQAHNDQGEEEPLLGKENNQFKLSKEQPAIARKITILPCMTDPRLLTALLVAFVQALLLGSFDATVPTTEKSSSDLTRSKAGRFFCLWVPSTSSSGPSPVGLSIVMEPSLVRSSGTPISSQFWSCSASLTRAARIRYYYMAVFSRFVA